jgi:hypothetical protein
MKLPTGVIAALLFLALILLLVGGVWLFRTLMPADSGAPTSPLGVFGSLFPFGQGAVRIDDSPGGTGGVDGPLSQVRRVTDAPVAGAQFVRRSDGIEVLRYVERDTGHWYEMPTDSGTVTRLTNTTIPGVRSALAVSSTTMVLRILDDFGVVESFAGVYTSTSTDTGLEGSMLPTYARLDTFEGRIVGVRENDFGSTVESVTQDGVETKTLFTSALKTWVPHVRGERVFLTSAPGATTVGSWYEVVNGTLTRKIDSLFGLEVLPNDDGSRALVSTGGVNNSLLSVFYEDTGELSSLPLRTLVGKCVWQTRTIVVCAVPTDLPQGQYPNDWLLGRIQTEDDLWRIDTELGTTEALVELGNFVETPIDAYELVLSESATSVSFIDKRDRGLWIAQITP